MKSTEAGTREVVPPRLARLLLTLVLPASEREFVLGDLNEEFYSQLHRTGCRQACRWYWKEALQAPGWWHRTSPDFVPAHAEAVKGEFMLSVIQDIRYAFRSLAKSRSLVIFALLALGLGIGANTAVFSVVNGILLSPLPYAQPGRLVRVWDSNPPANLPFFSVAHGNFLEWEKQKNIFAGLGAYREDGFSISGSSSGDPAQRLTGARVTAGLLPALGVSPVIGRWFTADEDRPGAERVVILGHALWSRTFGADAGIIGRDVRIEGEPHTVVGVMPPKFRVPIEGAELWVPYALDPARADRQSHFLRVLGRLAPAVTIEEAGTQLDRVAERLEENDPATRRGWRVRILPLDEAVTGELGSKLWIMFGAVALVLLIASANVANLLLARSISRRREIAVRLSLGASRARLLRQLLIESTILSILGGAVGIALAAAGVRLLQAEGPSNIPRLTDTALDIRVLAFTAVVSILTGLLFGVIPAMRGSRLDLLEGLKLRSHGSTAGRHDHRAGRLLVVAQVTIAMVVVISSGLMLRTVWNLYAIDPGFDTEERFTFGINLNSQKYSQVEARTAFLVAILERLRAIPGVRNVAATHRLPMTGNSGLSVDIEGRAIPQPGQRPTVIYRSITPEYFNVTGIPLLRGRTFDSRESRSGGPVIVINQRMAAQFWPGDDPIGKRIRSGPGSPWLTVIGVVADSRENRLDSDAQVGMYLPYPSTPIQAMIIIVRTAAAPDSIAGAIRYAMQGLDPDVAIADMRPLEDVVSASIAQRSFMAMLLAIFAGIALLLATFGIYGVLAYAVTQRVREIGMRMALGADRRTVLKQVIADGLRLTLPGVAAGTVGAAAATHLLEGLLFGVEAIDPLTFFAIAAFLTLTGILACCIPARKAASVDPVVALRNE
jgi:putative ABC transport system permease protein